MNAKRSRRRKVGCAIAFSRPRCVYRDSRSHGRVRYGLRMVRLMSLPIVSAVIPEQSRELKILAAVLLFSYRAHEKTVTCLYEHISDPCYLRI